MLGTILEPETTTLRGRGSCMDSGTYSLVLLFLEKFAEFSAWSIPKAPFTGDAESPPTLRFLGVVRAKTIGSVGYAMPAIGGSIAVVNGAESPSKARLHGPGEVDRVIGEGRGVMSAKGPTPGDETADPGERELTLDRAVDKADLTLELRTGNPAFSKMF